MSDMHLTTCPGGDVTIVLRKPNAQKLEWDEFRKDTASEQTANNIEQGINTFLPTTKVTKEPLSRFSAPRAVKTRITEQELEQQVHARSGQTFAIRILVSCHHLKHASAVFKKMLDGPWREGQLIAVGTREIETSEWNAYALQLVLEVIHGDTAAIPRSVNIDLLGKIAAIVDYYDCQHVMRFFANLWMHDLMPDLLKKYGRGSAIGLFVASVFKQQTHMLSLARFTCLNLEQPPTTKGFTFAPVYMDKILERRVELIAKIFQTLDDLTVTLLERHADEPLGHAVFMGSYTISMHEEQLNKDQRLPRPFYGYSVNGFINLVMAIRKASSSVVASHQQVKQQADHFLGTSVASLFRQLTEIHNKFSFAKSDFRFCEDGYTSGQ